MNTAERDADAGLNHLPNKHYFGAVFLTERDSPGLQMLVNREGFIPNQALSNLTAIVRTGIDLSTRVQMAASQRKRADRRVQRKTPDASPSTPYLSATQIAQQSMHEAKAHATKAREFVSAGKIDSASREFLSALSEVENITSRTEETSQESAMLRVLASVGTQVASFIHEINGLIDMATAMEQTLNKIANMQGLPKEHRRELAALQRDVGEPWVLYVRRRLDLALVSVISADRQADHLAQCAARSSAVIDWTWCGSARAGRDRAQPNSPAALCREHAWFKGSRVETPGPFPKADGKRAHPSQG